MSKSILVVNEKFKNKFKSTGFTVKTPMEYILSQPENGKYKVFNLASNMGYQENGYYVSLLATARRDMVLPSVRTIQDLNDRRINKVLSEDISELLQHSLKSLKSDAFELSVYFGKNITASYDKLSWELYRIIQAPMFRVYFEHKGSWDIKKIRMLTPSCVSPSHLDFVIEAAQNYLELNRYSKLANKRYLYDIGILYNEKESHPPSDAKAMKKFINAFSKNGFKVHLIQNHEKPDINNYDALFIRETTNVTHHTYRMARRAEIERLVVVDDPDSIVRCTNKVYLEQLLSRLKIKRPHTIILDSKNYQEQLGSIKFPCVVKQPDSAFSQGVHKADDLIELEELLKSLFKSTELLIIQEFLVTDFDWRIGILNGEVLYACKYYMAKGHWQIINNVEGKMDEGGFECVDPVKVDEKVIKTALRVAKEIGTGLYGVDLKQKDDQVYFIEINDNPSIESGVEDKFCGEVLYDKIAKYFLNECNKRRGYDGEKA